MFRRPPLHYPERPLHHFLQDAADRHPEKIALRFEDDAYTYRELDSTGNSFANALLALGFGPGTRVALAITNRPEWIIAQHGVSLAGGAVVLPNPTLEGVGVRARLRAHPPRRRRGRRRAGRGARRGRRARHAHLCRRRRAARVAVVLGPRVRHARATPGTVAREPRSTPTTRTRSARGRRACPRRCATPTGRWSPRSSTGTRRVRCAKTITCSSSCRCSTSTGSRSRAARGCRPRPSRCSRASTSTRCCRTSSRPR